MSYCPQHGVYLPCWMCKPAPSPQPEMPNHAMTLLQTLPRVEILSYSDLTWALRKAGLYIIDAKQKAVLDASRLVSDRWLEGYVNIIVPTQADPQAFAWAQAELARRKP
jgi:hypothetical protein